MKNKKIIFDFWMENFLDVTGKHCSLCGNSGKIDTTNIAYTAAGLHVGKLNYCICPNGRALHNKEKKNYEKII